MKTFQTVRMTDVNAGEMFLPIEKRGEPTWDNRRKRWDKRWAKAPRSYVCTGKCQGTDESGNDGLFAVGDWAIVEREVVSSVSGNAVARLNRHFGH
jgi:hypothetical protein